MLYATKPFVVNKALLFMTALSGRDIPYMESCKALYEELKKQKLIHPPRMEPKVGDLILWPYVNDYGDCTMYLGKKQMLMIKNNDEVMVVKFNYYANASFFIL